MKKLLCVLPALLLLAMVVPTARADLYTATLACGAPIVGARGPCPFGVAPTSTDALFPDGNFAVTVVEPGTSTSAVFDITLPAAWAPTDTYGWSFNSGHGTPFMDDFEVINETDSLAEFYYVSGTPDTLPNCGEGCLDGGTLTFTPASAAAPEPAPVLLMLLGAGLIFFFTRKRFLFGASQPA